MVTALMIAESLGGWGVLRARLADYAAVIDRTRSGLPYAALEALSKRYAIALPRVARVVGLPARTHARRKKERQLSAAESDRLLRLARVAAGAERTLGAADKAGQWLQKPNRALRGAAPLDLLDTDLGAEEVTTVLGRIEHGVYS
ncbi:MAG TPA: antitoxin Xre/MbcA/ParS toxin-binding domain-containing protein [Methylomirabilota bacterium]|nr:antitoxin Xre/MbcA/ParS toxin-binding domain-containing protein [Methylomirabilota bacterium]